MGKRVGVVLGAAIAVLLTSTLALGWTGRGLAPGLNSGRPPFKAQLLPPRDAKPTQAPSLAASATSTPMATPTSTATPTPASQPTAPPAPRPTPPPPAMPCSIAFGMYQSNAPWSWGQINSIESQINRHSAIVHWYAQWGNQSGVFNPTELNMLNAVRQHGSLSLITWEPWVGPPATNNPYPLKSIAAGQFDAYVDSWAAGLKAFGHPVMLRWGPEMQGNWLPWGANINGNTPADYIAAYRHVHDRFAKAGVRNVQWVFGADGDPNGGFPPLGNFYPGDAYVDWLGSDIYNVGTTQQYGTWQPMSARLQLSYSRLTALNATKPIVLAEFGSVEQGGSKAAWVQQAAVDLPRLFPRVKAVVWFSEGIYSLTTSAAAITGERAAFGSAPFCLTLPY